MEKVFCPSCPKVFAIKASLTRHMQVHKGYRYSCTSCEKGFLEKRGYDNHMISHKKTKFHVCQYCQKSFQYKKIFETHFSTCVKRFTSQDLTDNLAPQTSRLPEHFQFLNNKTQKNTNVLDRVMSDGSDVSVMSVGSNFSLLSKHSDTTYSVLSDQMESFESKEIKKNTLEAHKHMKSFWCGKCSKGFYRKDNFKNHMNRHRNAVSRSTLDKTLNGVRQEDKLLVSSALGCPKCPKVFSSSGCLSRHLRMHSGVFSFWCGKCSKGFYRKDSFKNHMNTHKSAVRTLSNTLDDLSTTNSTVDNLSTPNSPPQNLLIAVSTKNKLQHMLSNRKKSRTTTSYKKAPKGKLHACTYCSKYFTAGSLARHVLEHTGNYPFYCKPCQKGFPFKSDFQRHRSNNKHN